LGFVSLKKEKDGKNRYFFLPIAVFAIRRAIPGVKPGDVRIIPTSEGCSVSCFSILPVTGFTHSVS
jgi:hypothetical protein